MNAPSDYEAMQVQRFSEICPAPILRLHRHRDGYIAFASMRDGDDFRPLISIKASELETWFPMIREQLEKDSYVAINGDWRLKRNGPDGDLYGYPLHRTDRLRYINACYVDIDFKKLGLESGTVIGRVINLQDSGQLPHASMIVRSGNGLWLLWLLHDVENPDISQRAFPDKLELYARIQNAIIERLLPLGADMSARDAARHLRIPGSMNTSAERTVEWWIQGAGPTGYYYTLPELAKLFKAVPTRRHHGEYIAHNPAKRRGWVALNARRLKDFNTLRALRGGFSEGCRNNAAKIYAWLLRVNATGPDDVRQFVLYMASQCKPKLDKSAARDAFLYSKKMRRMRDQTIADWLGITVEESEMLEGFPPASTFRTADQTPLLPRARDLQRAAVQERRQAIREIITELCCVPHLRGLAVMLAWRGIAASHVTIWNDLQALKSAGVSLSLYAVNAEQIQEPTPTETLCNSLDKP
jgi:hypothetical protein